MQDEQSRLEIRENKLKEWKERVEQEREEKKRRFIVSSHLMLQKLLTPITQQRRTPEART